MKLRELEVELVSYYSRSSTAEELELNPGYPQHTGYRLVEKLEDADGVWFLCPKCFKANGGEVGTHAVRIGFKGIAKPGTYGYNKKGEPVLWAMQGHGVDDLQLTPSIQLEGGCNWHGYVGSSGVPPGEAA